MYQNLVVRPQIAGARESVHLDDWPAAEASAIDTGALRQDRSRPRARVARPAGAHPGQDQGPSAASRRAHHHGSSPGAGRVGPEAARGGAQRGRDDPRPDGRRPPVCRVPPQAQLSFARATRSRQGGAGAQEGDGRHALGEGRRAGRHAHGRPSDVARRRRARSRGRRDRVRGARGLRRGWRPRRRRRSRHADRPRLSSTGASRTSS